MHIFLQKNDSYISIDIGALEFWLWYYVEQLLNIPGARTLIHSWVEKRLIDKNAAHSYMRTLIDTYKVCNVISQVSIEWLQI